MTDFRFAQPEYLLALLAVPLIQIVLARIRSNAREKLLRFLHESNLSELLKERGRIGYGKTFLFWLGLTLSIVALARPQANPRVEEREGASLDIYVLLDVSRSMDAEDIAPSRLKKAKRSIQTLTELLSGDRVGVIAFAGSSVMVTPLTADYGLLNTFLKNVDSSMIQNQGTDIAQALKVAEEAMGRGAEKTGTEGPRSNVFIVMSDGEAHNEQSWEAAGNIRKNGGIVFSIAFGTEQGSTIPVRNERGELVGQKRTFGGEPVKTSVQAGSLQAIAKEGGGQFYFSTSGEEEIRDILKRVQGMERTGATVMRAKVYEELFPFVLGPALAVLLLSFVSLQGLLGVRLRMPKLKSSRLIRGKSAAFLLAAFTLPAFSAEAHAFPLFWNKEKKAYERSQELAAEGKPEDAVNQLKGLLAEDPDNPALNFDVGTYLIEGKKGEEARAQLKRATGSENPLREKALFNIAGSLAQEGKKEEARAAYGDLLQTLKGKEDPEAKALEGLTRENLARLAEDQKEQQQNQQDQKQDSQGGGQGEDKKDKKENKEQNPGNQGENDQSKNQKPEDKDQDKEGKGEKPQDKPDQGDKKDSDEDSKADEPAKQEGQQQPKGGMKGRRPFKERDNMGEEEAKKILEALSQRESGVQKRFLKNKEEKGNFSPKENPNDW